MKLLENAGTEGGAPRKPEPEGQAPSVPLPDDALILLPVRETVLFPGVIFPITVGRPASVAAIQQAVRHVVEQPGRTTAPAALLLTEELVVPWELATFTPRLATTWGGQSPFLGAHVAIARWPLDEHKPRPRPRPNVAVRAAAVLTADYTGVPNWKKLESALAEADEVAKLFDPPATPVHVTAQTGDATDVVVLYTRWGRQRMRPAEGGGFEGRFPSPLEPGLRHLAVNAIAHGTIYDDVAPYDSKAWGIPFIVGPADTMVATN